MLAQGTLSIASDGTVTASGACDAVHTALVGALTSTVGSWPPAGCTLVAAERAIAPIVIAIAGLVPYLVSNTEVTCTVPADSSGDGLQAGTTHPSSPKDIGGTIA